MNIQIYGKAKCFDTKKAERYFKERKVKYQFIDLPRYGMSAGEYRSVRGAGIKLSELFDEKSKAYEERFIAHLAHERDKEQKLLDYPELFRTPIVRNGKKATVGYAPEVWAAWE